MGVGEGRFGGSGAVPADVGAHGNLGTLYPKVVSLGGPMALVL